MVQPQSRIKFYCIVDRSKQNQIRQDGSYKIATSFQILMSVCQVFQIMALQPSLSILTLQTVTLATVKTTMVSILTLCLDTVVRHGPPVPHTTTQSVSSTRKTATIAATQAVAGLAHGATPVIRPSGGSHAVYSIVQVQQTQTFG